MNLQDWLFRNRISVTHFAGLLKVDRSYVHKWLRGQCVPTDRIMERINNLTIGVISKPEELIDEKRKRKAIRKKENKKANADVE